MVVHAGVPEVEALQVRHCRALDVRGKLEGLAQAGELEEVVRDEGEFVLDREVLHLGRRWVRCGSRERFLRGSRRPLPVRQSLFRCNCKLESGLLFLPRAWTVRAPLPSGSGLCAQCRVWTTSISSSWGRRSFVRSASREKSTSASQLVKTKTPSLLELGGHLKQRHLASLPLRFAVLSAVLLSRCLALALALVLRALGAIAIAVYASILSTARSMAGLRR